MGRSDPERARRILSTIADVYVSQNLNDALTATNSAGDWPRGQLDKLKVDLESSEMALHDYKMTENILSVAFDDQSNSLREIALPALTRIAAKISQITALPMKAVTASMA